MIYKRRVNPIVLAISGLMIIIVVSIVYAAFTGQLNIQGGTGVGRVSNWDIHFEKVSSIMTTGSAKVLNNHQPKVNIDYPTQIDDYEVSLTSPTDSISFTFDVVNGGNYNAKVSNIKISSPECDVNGDKTDQSAINMCNNLTYTFTYTGGATVQTNDILFAKDKLSFKVTLTFNDITNPDLLPKDEVTISNLGITLDFEQVGSAEVGDNGVVQNNKVYHIGDKITINNEDYWVIENSGAGQDYVVALKDERLTKEKINLYGGSGTDNNHVNKYTKNLVGYSNGGVAYYSSETCGYVNGSLIEDGCKTDYDQSDVKYVVDSWGEASFSNNELKDVNGYKSRLITKSEYESINNAYSWKTKQGYCWTMTPDDNNKRVYYANSIYGIASDAVHGGNLSGSFCVRPVINVYKSALE